MTKRINEALWVVFSLALVVTVVASIKHSYGDFDLNYFGGLIQRHGHAYTRTDLLIHSAAAQHRTVPAEGLWGTPSLIALLFVPLSLLKLSAAHLAWNVVAIAGIVLGLRWASSSKSWPVYVALVVLSPAMLEAFNIGNAASLTFILTTLTYAALRHNQSRVAGGILAVAAMLKAYPAVGILAAIKNRNWQMIRVAAAVAISMLVLTVIVLGPDSSKPAFEHLRNVSSRVPLNLYNAGIPGIAVGIFHSVAIARVLGLVALVAGTIVLWRTKRINTATLFVLFEILTVVTQPLAWRMYFGVAVLGLIALLEETGASTRQRIAGVFFALLALAYPGYLIDIDANGTLIAMLQTGGAIALMAIVISVSKRTSLSDDKSNTSRPLESSS